MLFDSGANGSYISSRFANEQRVPVTPRLNAIVTSSPLGNMRCTHLCRGVRIDIEGHPFLANLTLLPSNGLDVILEMDWLTQHKGLISCSPRYVEFTHPNGHVIRCEPNHGKSVSMLCALETKTLEEVPVICEYPDVFPEELPVCHPTGMWSS